MIIAQTKWFPHVGNYTNNHLCLFSITLCCRTQRDEWCDLLRSFLNCGESNQSSQESVRDRSATETKSNRPEPRRNARPHGSATTAPGTLQGAFKEELENVLKVRKVKSLQKLL